jgi:hypothetical protein
MCFRIFFSNYCNSFQIPLRYSIQIQAKLSRDLLSICFLSAAIGGLIKPKLFDICTCYLEIVASVITLPLLAIFRTLGIHALRTSI